MNVKIVTNINTKCPCHICKILSAFNHQWEVAERRSLTDVRWLCNWWRGTFIDTNDVVDDKGQAWIRYWLCDALKMEEWTGANEHERDVSNACCVDVCKLRMWKAERIWTCGWISWVWEWIEFPNVNANVIECECECVSVRVVSLADLLQQHGLPTPCAALSGGVWYCKCGMPDD